MTYKTAESTAPARGVLAVTPADGSNLSIPSSTTSIGTAAPAVTRALYVGGAGDVAVRMADGTSATFSAVPAGALLPIQVDRVLSTGTTATLILALY